MKNYQMEFVLVKLVHSQLSRIAISKIANHKSTPLDPKFPFVPLVGKYIKKTSPERILIDTDQNIETKPTFSSTMNNITTKIDNQTLDDVRAMEQDIAYCINVARQNYSKGPNFKSKPFLLKNLQHSFTFRT